MHILAWEYETTGRYKNPYDNFTRRRGGKNGAMNYRELTVYFNGDDTIGFY